MQNEILEEIEQAHGNLWEWRESNPYQSHPLNLLGFDHLAKVSPARISAAVKKLQDRGRQEKKDSEERGPMTPGRAGDLLSTPALRLICELMRIPPVALSQAEAAELVRLWRELPVNPGQLPHPDRVRLDGKKLAGEFRRAMLAEFPKELSCPDFQPDLDPPPRLPRQDRLGISFLPRRDFEEASQ